MDPDRFEAALLGAPLELTRDQVHAAAGVDEATARALWRATGLPEVPPGVTAFTRSDVEALRSALALQDGGLLDPGTVLVLARSMGQSMARMAEAQVEVLGRAGVEVAAAGGALPELERLVVQVWRRQLAAAAGRALAESGLAPDGQPVRAVGFVDLVDYTRRARGWDASTLARTLEQFESRTALRVTALGGQVVKTLGDAVLFSAPSVRAAVEVALQSVEAHRSDEELPDVRAGLAWGPVLVRMGDVFGGPVNLASRLLDEARPASALVDEQAAGLLAKDGAYVLTRLRRRSVRGYRALTPFLVRRS